MQALLSRRAVRQCSLPVKPAQQRVGHASAMTVLDRYARLWPDDEDRARDAVDAEFGSPADL